MKERHLAYLCCPNCRSDFQLESVERLGGDVVTGNLRCAACAISYPIRRGVARILPQNLAEDKRASAEAFGYEWTRFAELKPEYREQFLDWIGPLTPSDFSGKLVLDAGCGKGRHAYWAAKFGARDVIGVDLGEAVDVACANTREFTNVSVIQADIYHLPLKPVFDLAYSIGVLHHLPDPGQGFDALVRAVRPFGTVAAWVYGREGNGWIIRWFNPIRKHLTSRLPYPLGRALAFALTCGLQIIIKFVYRPVNTYRWLGGLRRLLFYNDYLYDISKFSFRENYSIVFDHLVAPTAFYIAHDEFQQWFDRNGLTDVNISWRNKNSWRGVGKKPL